MSEPIRITVRPIDAGSIPRNVWSERDACWKAVRLERTSDELPPRVLLEVTEEGANALAAHLFEEVEIIVNPAAEREQP